MAYHAIVGGYADETLYPASGMDPICEATIDHLIGVSVVRDRFRIYFDVQGHEPYEHFLIFMKKRFFQTLKRLQGFRKLSLVMVLINLSKDDLSVEVQQDIGEMTVQLEPDLGLCVAKSLTHSEHWSKRLHLVYEWEFHPLKSQIESLQAEAARLAEDVKIFER